MGLGLGAEKRLSAGSTARLALAPRVLRNPPQVAINRNPIDHLPPGPFILLGLALLANGLWKQYQMRQDVLTLGKEDAAKKWCPDVISKAAEKQRKIMGEANIVE